MPDSPTDDELFARLTDPTSPRTPLHLKLVVRQWASDAVPWTANYAPSAFHRTDGYHCGATNASVKPISKLFGPDDEP